MEGMYVYRSAWDWRPTCAMPMTGRRVPRNHDQPQPRYGRVFRVRYARNPIAEDRDGGERHLGPEPDRSLQWKDAGRTPPVSMARRSSRGRRRRRPRHSRADPNGMSARRTAADPFCAAQVDERGGEGIAKRGTFSLRTGPSRRQLKGSSSSQPSEPTERPGVDEHQREGERDDHGPREQAQGERDDEGPRSAPGPGAAPIPGRRTWRRARRTWRGRPSARQTQATDSTWSG